MADPYNGEPPFVAGSDTSEDAAMSVSLEAPVIRAKCLALIERSGTVGVTCDELEVMLRMRHQTISARVRELVLMEEIYDTGARRKTRSGRGARVYRAGLSPLPVVKVGADGQVAMLC